MGTNKEHFKERQTPLMAEPLSAQAVAVAQQPVAADQRVAGLDPAGFDHRLQFGHRLDYDADVLLLFGEAMDAGGATRVDAAAEQHHGLVGIARRRQAALDRDPLAQ